MATVNLTKIVDAGVSYGFDMSNPFFPSDADAVDASWASTTFRLYYDYGHKYYDEFVGTGFAYDSSGLPVGGQISQWNYYWNGAANMKVSGLNMSVADYMSYVGAGDWSGFLQTALAGNDTINGSSAADVLYAYNGNDTVNAGDYYDQVWGGEGNDTLTGAGGDDDLYGEGGDDTLDGGALEDWLYGGEGNDKLSGGGGDDQLFGEGGDDKLDGGTGNDLLDGGDGNDTYIVDSAGDVVHEGSGLGDDTVKSSVSFDASGTGVDEIEIERIELTGSANLYAKGGAINNTIIGNSGANYLEGGDGDDVLNGGTGADHLNGGSGDDSYYIDNVGDTIDADVGGSVFSTITYTLGNGLEQLTLLGVGAINATGNSQDNVLTGNDGANILDGNGGRDYLAGGKGNDTYIVDDGDDVLNEALSNAAGGGIDTVKTSVDFDMSDDTDGIRSNVDNAILMAGAAHVSGNGLANIIIGAGLTADLTLSGGDGNDTLTGGSGNDTLDGGAGIDVLKGGAGNDIYISDLVINGGVISLQDSLSENGNEGQRDEIILRTLNSTFILLDPSTMVLGANFEVLDASQANVNKLNLTGNALNNELIGNKGTNRLDGGGGDDVLIAGEGNDTLNGGLGNDVMKGGAGTDIYFVDNLNDAVDEEGNSDADDEIRTSVPIGAAVAGVEHYTYSGALAWNFGGTAEVNKITGGSGIDKISGGAGNDQLFGNAGNDELDGGDDDDVLTGGAGNDKLVGGAGNDQLFGSDGNDDVSGDDGDDLLDGGTSADKLAGGSGNDTYIVDNAGDVVIETGSDSGDIVKSSITYTLGDGVEHLTLTGTGALNGTGNGLVNYIIGTDGANILDGRGGGDALWGGKGNDTYFVDDVHDNLSEDIFNEPGGGIDLVKSTIEYELLNGFENLTLLGTGDIAGYGNSANNVIIGNSGNNELIGWAGKDTLIGGAGDDTYRADISALNGKIILDDVVVENANEGIDTLILDDFFTGLPAGATFTLGANFENVDASMVDTVLNVTGNALGNTIIASHANFTTSKQNVLDGAAGNDTIVGYNMADIIVGGAGNDVMRGAAGNDIYFVDSSGDVVDEEGNTDSDDEIRTSIPIAAAVVDVEHYTYTGKAAWTFTGTDAANKIAGGSGNDELTGAAGDDVLDGGAGKDKLIGGDGDDTYIVDNVGDMIVENGTDGGDRVKTTINYTLLDELEHLTLTGTGAINGTGNAAGNEITGNDGANILDGKAGDDILAGGKGNDTYVIDTINDVVNESVANTAGGGIDTVKTSVDFDMADDKNGIHSNIDNAILQTGALIVYGNALNNVISGAGLTGDLRFDGAGGNDTLTGGVGNDYLYGGSGIDTLAGGGGNDTYDVDLALAGAKAKLEDTVTEGSNAGTEDTIFLHGDLTLAAATTLTLGANIENLDASDTGTTKLHLTGNALNNELVGNAADNILNGGGGDDELWGSWGNDTLTGGAGHDVFHYTNNNDGGAGETITDFVKGTDILDVHDLLAGAGFSGGGDLADYLQMGTFGKDTVVKFDADGAGTAFGFETLVTVKNVVLTVADLDSVVI